MRACRYVLLYLYGGIYLDLDVECTKPLDFLRAYPFVMPATRPVGFSNDFLAAAPQHPFVGRLIRALPAWNVWWLSKYPTVMFSTGPMFVTLQASLFTRRRALWVLPDELYGKYVPGRAAVFRHLFGSSWHGEDAKSLIWLVRHPALIACVVGMLAVAGAWVLWRKHCAAPRSGAVAGAAAAAQSAALKMC
jgi:mannosyltransferase OCH1-like enzyme